MQKWPFLLLLFTIFFYTVNPVQAADPFASQKNAYITSHPGQTIIPYPWETSTSTRILPFNYDIPAAPSNAFSLAACPDQFEAASFIISTQKSIAGIGISVSDLRNGQSYSIPSSAIDVRLVKVWYQAAADNVWLDHNEYVLAPELLLKDDSLVQVDYVNRTNYLKVTTNGHQHYIDISSPTAVFPITATITDASSLQPFTMAANENKQIWLTVHVPDDTPAGNYHGNIVITAPSEPPVIMDFTVTVLPFKLEPAPLEYALYYRGQLTSAVTPEIGSERKTPTQYAAELKDMKDHGVLYPVLYQEPGTMLRTALSLREQSGLSTDHIYIASLGTGTSSTTASLANLATRVKEWKNITSEYGYSEIYAYGIDEADSSVLLSERIAWQTVHQNGAKVFVALGSAHSNDAVNLVGDLLDVPVVAGPLNATQAARWHRYGNKIFSYANPEVGIENAELYRKNYGFSLWNTGYDGTMNYAYQYEFRDIWNDYDRGDEPHWRDYVFAYPTSNGIIDTIQWEGWREGVDDTRFVATLLKMEGNDIAARSIVSSSLSAGINMATIRKRVIDRVLLSNPISHEDKIGFYQKSTGTFFLKNSNSNGNADNVFRFGWSSSSGDLVPLVGDWDGDGIDTVGLYEKSTGTFLLKNSNSAGDQDTVFLYGWGTRSGDLVPLVGDWNNNDDDTVGLYEKSTGTFFLKNSNAAGDADLVFQYGAGGADWVPMVGDWDGDGIDTVGNYQKSIGGFFLKNSNMYGDADLVFPYGAGGADWDHLAGDWDGDGDDTVGAYQKSIGAFFLKNSNTYGNADTAFQFGWGSSGDLIPLTGRWV